MENAKKRLVFVGGGHVHLFSLKHAEELIKNNAEVVLIGPDRFHYYSGMGPGMLSRIYQPEQVRFDVQRTVESRGGRFIQGRVASVNAKEKTLFLEGGEKVAYDLVSFNIGSRVPMHLITGAEKEAFPVKPIETLEKVRSKILEKRRTENQKIVVIGGGPAGVEMAGNFWRLLKEESVPGEIILLNSSKNLLPHMPERAGRLAEQSLSKRGITIINDSHVVFLSDGVVYPESGEEIAFDIALLTIGIRPPDLFFRSGLKIADDGALLVNDYLQSVDYPEIFGGGDCIALQGGPLDRVGVYAVREAPVLFDNLLASLQEKPLEKFAPQKRYLLIFNMGDGTGIFVRGSFVWKGRLAFYLKNYLDTSFMSKFQVV